VERATAAGLDPVKDVVDQLQAKNAFLANLSIFKANNKMAGALLDEKA
jgi:flagellar basal body rod protein FlgC